MGNMFLQEAQLQVQVEVGPDMTTDARGRVGDSSRVPSGRLGAAHRSGNLLLVRELPTWSESPQVEMQIRNSAEMQKTKAAGAEEFRSNRRLRSLLSVGANGGENQQSSKP